MKIIAKVPILYNSVTYKPGDELPNNNPEMTKAWKEAGTGRTIIFLPERRNRSLLFLRNKSYVQMVKLLIRIQ